MQHPPQSLISRQKQSSCHYLISPCKTLKPFPHQTHLKSLQTLKMDMDMEDMDIPLPEELELLESESHLYEQEFYYPPDFDDSTEPQPEQPPPDPAQPETNNHKRSRSRSHSSSPPGLDPSDQEKRAKVRVSVEDSHSDEDEWLRFSPRPVPVEEPKSWKDGMLSRYASEIDGEFMPVTAPNGDRVYAKLDRFLGDERATKLTCRENSSDLCLEPISNLFEKLEQETLDKTLQASLESQSVEGVTKTPTVHEQLWVDKYAPKSFTELLSDEQTNREVLLWLKLWDSTVYGSEIRNTSDEVLSALKQHSSVTQNHKPLDSKFPRKNRESKWSSRSYANSTSTDECDNSKTIQDVWNSKSRTIGPPEQKILLLCGPPGLGKTTLAHVAARHCGYDVLEVNASDDRSTSAIEAKIRDVVEMNSVLSHSRPKCLVVDEIDGALGDGRGAVEVLLKLVSAERKPNGGNKSLGERQLDGKSSKKRQKTASLSRPVICICNDLYAPALRPLRQVAKVHIFVQPTVSRVVSRLKYICYKEGMKATAIALTALAEYTECDIRSCLNTLQFVSKNKETLNAIDIGSQVVGQKDMSKNVLDIWKQFFQRKRTKKMERESRRSKSFEFDYLYSLISNRGDSDLFLDGIHENILQLNYHDPVMQKTVKCFNSLGVYDLMHQYIMCTQQMRIHVYLPAIAVNIHHVVAQIQKPNIEWPKSYQRCRAMMMERMDILKTWHYQISPSIARNLSASSFVEDLISPLLHILSPPTIRPVALQLLSDKEKNDLAELVSTMVSYAVTYKNMKPDILLHTVKYEGADDLGLSLVPPISNFINFKDYTSNHYVLSLAMKKVLVHEVEKHKILHVNNDKTVASVNGGHEIIDAGTNKVPLANTNRATAVDLKTNENQANVFARQLNPNPITVSQNSNPNGSANATDKAKLLMMGKLKKPSSSSSFFDRFKKLNVKGLQNDRSQQKEATLEKHRCPLLFKFNEGFTNAVKRPVRMREFLS